MRAISRIYILSMTFALVLSLTASQAQAGLISESSELSMGRDAAKQIEAKYPVSNDVAMNQLVKSMGKRIAAISERPNIAWTFKVLNSKEVNAMAVPGYVYVNKGLIDFIGRDKDQLAGVVAHEIGHTTGRHGVKQVEKQLYGTVIVGLIFKKSASKTANLLANLAMLGYSRKDEFDADSRAVRYTRAAGYDPNGMVEFFKKLQGKQGSGPSGLTTYFSTHPPTTDRIARVQAEIARTK